MFSDIRSSPRLASERGRVCGFHWLNRSPLLLPCQHVAFRSQDDANGAKFSLFAMRLPGFFPTRCDLKERKMSAIEAGARAPENLWRQEIRATLALAWPMVLTNLGQTAMTATDVMMMGRLGSDTLAAGALGSNLYFMPLIFGLGLMLATSPMMATELGMK